MHFDSDYMNICHPLILQRMQQMQDRQMPGYGTDPISQSARQKIRALCDCPDAEVQFLCGGTQTNMVMVNYLLRSFEGVLCADSAHVAVHESGAIEFTGHKVLTLPSTQGKITAEQVDDYITTYMLPGVKWTEGMLSSPVACYIHRQMKHYALDFDDLERVANYILDHFEDARTWWQEQLNYIMVDEAQDCNADNWQIVEKLAAGHGNLFVVGDPDQAIYEWRGARPEPRRLRAGAGLARPPIPSPRFRSSRGSG